MFLKLNEVYFRLRIIKFFSFLYAVIFFILGLYEITENGTNKFFDNIYSNLFYLLLSIIFMINGIKTKIKYFYFSVDNNELKYFLDKKEREVSISLKNIDDIKISDNNLWIKLNNKLVKQIDIERIKKQLSYNEIQTLERELKKLIILLKK